MLPTRPHACLRRPPNAFALAVLLCVFLCTLTGSAWAAVQTVSSIGDDATDATTLRGAIAAASPGDTIAFSLPANSTITLSQGELLISQNLTITGPGANQLTVSGANLNRVFHITSGIVTLLGVTVSGGSDSSFSGAGFFQEAGTLNLTSCTISGNTGGGLGQTGGSLSMNGCTVTGNSAIGGGGGGMGISGSATLTNCTITSNTADQSAGVGVYNGVATLTNCIISGNTAGTANFSGGGGVANYDGTLTITGCTLSGNTANYGAGLYTNNGTTTASNCTLSANTASGPIASGGGSENDHAGTLSLTSCTIAGNTANYGGGLYNNAAATLTGTLIAGNVGTDIETGTGQVSSNGSNLVGTASVTLAGPHDQINVADAKLGPLQDNGGPTQTIALLPGSPAIDADYNSGTVTDQRGLSRPQSTRSDIGAYEALIVTNTNDSGTGSLRAAILGANSIVTTATTPVVPVTFDPTVFATVQTITLTSGELAVTGSMAIEGPGANLLTVSGNNASRVFDVTSGTVALSGLTIKSGSSSGDSGGIRLVTATLNLTDSVVSDCHASSYGGGIRVIQGGTLNAVRCTFSGNSASQGGGGIYGLGTSILTNCTLFANSAGVFGGGIADEGPMMLVNCTISGNTSSGSGGGISPSANVVTLLSTIVAGNTANGGSPDVNAAILSEGSNLIGDAAGSSGFNGPHDQTGVSSPGLGGLAANGGTTPTIALLPGSPAIDADYNGATATDQRGVSRPQGVRSDIGAFEVLAPFAADDAYGTPFGAVLTVAAPGILANDTDPSGYALTPALVTGPAHGVLTLNADGSFTYTPSAAFSGTDSFTYQDMDSNGSLSWVATVTLMVAADTTPPVTTATLAGPNGTNGWYTGPVTVTLAATDDASGVAQTIYALDGGSPQAYTRPFTVSGDATHTVIFHSVDAAGNVEADKTQTVKIDGMAPALNFGAPMPSANANGYNNGPVTVPYTTTDVTSGLATASSGTLTFGAAGAGQTQTVTATDVAGNTHVFTSPPVSIDLVKPVTAATTQSTASGEMVTLGATDDLSGVASTVYVLDGGAVQTYTAAFTVPGNGAHIVVFHSVDKAGNVEADQTVRFTTNVAAPITSAALSGPAGTNGWYTGAVTVTLSAQAKGLPVAQTYFTIDGGVQQTYTSPFTVSGDKVHTVVFYSADTAGNQEAMNQKPVKIDATAPVTAGAVSGPQTSGGVFTGAATVTLSAADNLSGVAGTVYSVDGGTTQPYTTAFTVSGAGTHTVTFHSIDVASNAEADKTVTLTVQLTPVSPVVLHTFPAGLQLFSVPEDFSGVALGTALSQINPRLAIWAPSLLQYVITPTAPADALRPGQGYWARFGGATSLYDLGTPTPTGQPFAIALQKGWNMIGDPFPGAVGLSSVLVNGAGGQSLSLSNANKAGLVALTFYSYPAGSTQYQTEDQNGSLAPYTGYWLYAFQGCTLDVPAP